MKQDQHTQRWRLAEGFGERYYVGDRGCVYSKLSGKILRPRSNPEGYRFVALFDPKGGRSDIAVHRLVASAFVSNPEKKPCVNHLDGDKANNLSSNLEWCTHSENSRHSFATGLQSTRGELHPGARLNEAKVRVMRRCAAIGLRNKDIAEWFGVKPVTASAAIHGRNWSHVEHGGKLA